MKYWILLVLMLALSFGGCQINQMLTRLHYQDSAGSGLFAELCTPDAQPAFDCKAVTKTKWSMLPPNEPDPVTGEQSGLPIAVAGWFYFSAVFIWYLVIGRCDYARRHYHYLLLAFVCAGVATSLFFTYILLFTGMEHKCLWCMISHGINLLLLIGTILLRPRKPVAEASSDAAVEAAADVAPRTAGETGGPAGPLPLPGLRLVLAAVLCIVIAGQLELTANAAMHHFREFKKHQYLAEGYKRDAEIVYHDTEAHIARFDSRENLNIPIRPDDPRRGTAEFPLVMVVFSDFQCPGCRAFADTVEKTIAPDFDGNLQIVWKHYPLSKDCNPYIARGIHPQACTAAYAAEAARLQGGSEAFWKTHDLLFARQKQLPKLDYAVLATDLGLDPDRFVADMASDAVHSRVAEDLALGKKLEIKATPTVFLGDRKVERFMLTNEGFRKAINYRLQRARKQKLMVKRWQEMTPEERREMINATRKRRTEHAKHAAEHEHAAPVDAPNDSSAEESADAIEPDVADDEPR